MNAFLHWKFFHLINVGGLKDPAICLPQLRVCHWTVSNSPVSLILDACKLFELKLECCSPKSLIIRAPLLACLHLSMERPGELFKAEHMPNLRSLAVNSFELSSLIELLSGKILLRSYCWSSRFWPLMKMDIGMEFRKSHQTCPVLNS